HVPLRPMASFDLTRAVARSIAPQLVAGHPDRVTMAQRKQKRGWLFIDTLPNGYRQHVAAPYALCAKPGAPMAVPVGRDELRRGRPFGPPLRPGQWFEAPTGGPSVLMHFGMPGSLSWADDPHTDDRVVFHLEGGRLAYRSQRKLGSVWLSDPAVHGIIGTLG